MRSVASVSISLGLMNIPIKLYISASSERVNFNLINSKTGNRVKQLLVDSDDIDENGDLKRNAKLISRSDVLNGYEYEKGKYVCFSSEEIANMQEHRDTLNLKEFVPISEINYLHIEKTLYTAPDKSDRQYKILFEVLAAKKLAAVGTWISRGKEHLVLIRPAEQGLLIHQMFYNSEVRAFENKCANIDIDDLEYTSCYIIVNQFTKNKLDVSAYKDAFEDRVSEAVKSKLAGGIITKPDEKTILRTNLLAAGIPVNKVNYQVEKALKAKSRAKSKKAS